MPDMDTEMQVSEIWSIRMKGEAAPTAYTILRVHEWGVTASKAGAVRNVDILAGEIAEAQRV
jgi:hypothetical protein